MKLKRTGFYWISERFSEVPGINIAIGQLYWSVGTNQTVTWYTREKASGVLLYISARRSLKGPLGTKSFFKVWTVIWIFGSIYLAGWDGEAACFCCNLISPRS